MFLINPKILEWARNTIGMGIEEASKRLGVEADTLRKWEEGIEEAPFTKLNQFCVIYKRSSAIFLMDTIPLDNYPKDFRNHIENYTESLQRETLIAFRKARQIQTNFINIIGETVNPFIQEINNFKDDKDIESLVQKIQEIFGEEYSYTKRSVNDYEQLNYWKDKFAQLNILIIDLGFDRNDARAFLIYDNTAPIICLNTNDSPKARIFSIFHELSHLILKQSSLDSTKDFLDMKNKEEAYCNQFAGEFLVPKALLLKKLDSMDTNNQDLEHLLDTLSRTFVVSKYVILISLHKNNMIDKNEFNIHKSKLEDSYKQFEQRRKGSGGNYYSNYIVNNGKKYIQTVFNAFNSSKLSYNETLDYLGVKAENLSNIEYRAFK